MCVAGPPTTSCENMEDQTTPSNALASWCGVFDQNGHWTAGTGICAVVEASFLCASQFSVYGMQGFEDRTCSISVPIESACKLAASSSDDRQGRGTGRPILQEGHSMPNQKQYIMPPQAILTEVNVDCKQRESGCGSRKVVVQAIATSWGVPSSV